MHIEVHVKGRRYPVQVDCSVVDIDPEGHLACYENSVKVAMFHRDEWVHWEKVEYAELGEYMDDDSEGDEAEE